jgi:hypothetical protein
LENIGIRTQELFKRVNEARFKTHQHLFEDKMMALMFSLSFTALTKQWVDFKRDIIDIEEAQADVIETICRDKFNVELPGIVDELAMIAVKHALSEKIKHTLAQN